MIPIAFLIKCGQDENSRGKSNENDFEINDILENKDKNKDKNKNKEKNKEIEDVCNSSTNIYNFLEENFGRTISSLEFEKLDSWVKEFNEEIVKHAIKLAVMNNSKKFNYLEGILRNWRASGYTDLKDIIAYEDSIHYRSKKSDVNYDDIFDYNWLEDNE